MVTESSEQQSTQPASANPPSAPPCAAALVLQGGINLTDSLLLAALLAAPWAWLLGRLAFDLGPLPISISWGLKPILAPVALAALRALLKHAAARCGLQRRSWLWDRLIWRKLALAWVTIWVGLLAVEQILEKLGFEANVSPIVIKGENDEVFGKYGILGDPVFTWKFSPGGEFKGWKINALGFRDREVTEAKAPGTVRVICFGDSCSADGGPPYSGCLHQLLRNNPPTGNSWEAFNMAVYGYSSVQGLKVFQLRGKQLHPDIVTLYFGWNDHWMCGYRPDSNNQAFRMGRIGGAVMNVLRQKRFGQLLIKALTPGRNIAIEKIHGRLPADIEERYRVPPEEYRYTLSRFVREIRSSGAIPVLITAPRGPQLTPLLVKNGQGSSIEQLDKAHAQYLAITREVARDLNAELLDLATLLANEASAPLFNRDGIHLTQDGLWRIAELIDAKLRQIAQSPAWKERSTPP
jgi:lysophospholipase L1-like esterase